MAKDKFPDVSLDEVFCDPVKASFFDRTAQTIRTGASSRFQYRWAALRLRKASRELVDEGEAVSLCVQQARLQPVLDVARSESEASQQNSQDLPAARRGEAAFICRANK